MGAYLISGLSGTGKTSLQKELVRRGYLAIETDYELGLCSWINNETGLKVPDNRPLPEKTAQWISQHVWSWDAERLHALIANSTGQNIFFCGGAHNAVDFNDLFTKRFALIIDTATMRHRLQAREPERWYDNSPELVRMLGWNQNYRQDHADDGTICIDGTMATSRITDEVLEYVHAS